MTSLAALAFAFLSTVQSGELVPRYGVVDWSPGDPSLYVVVENPAPEGGALRPVVLLPAEWSRTSLDSKAVAVAMAAGPGALVVAPVDVATARLCATLALRGEFKDAAARGRSPGEWGRPVVVAEGRGARHALLDFDWDSAEFAAMVLLAPHELSVAELGSVERTYSAPMALLRGSEDPRGTLLSILERRLDLGAETSLDFAATCEHATLECNEGYLARRLKEFLDAEERRAAAETAVRAVLDRFHGAAAKADGKEYFACLAPDAIFIGTDASERWTVPQFRAFCEPYFSKGKGWTYTASERHVYLAPDLRSAWFDESLDNESYGKVRGSGVLRLDGERWRITQYVLSIPVPNELAKDLVQRIRERR